MIDALVEQVKDGSTLRLRLFLSSDEHQMAIVSLAGVRSPRVVTRDGETPELWGEEARFFTESRLLQRSVRVQLLSLPTLNPAPLHAGSGVAGSPASVFIGIVLHPAGNVAEHLVAAGLARVVEWHAGMLATIGGLERIRAAEKSAKDRRICLYENVTTNATGIENDLASSGLSKTFDATVIRIWSGDQVSIAERVTGKEHRVQLSSTKGPKPSDPKQSFYAHEAREFLRKKLIGKHVKVHIDFVRPRDGEFEERECVTIHYGGHHANVAQQLIEKGLATVVRHRRDDEDRSLEYDKLIAAEQTAVTDSRGIHSGKVVPALKPPLNVSESSSRAQQFLNGYKRQGKIPAVVDYVSTGSRFKIFLPRDNQMLTLVLNGIRAPRNGRNPTEKGEPYGAEAAEFMSRKCMQRDVEFEVDAVDKSGGFIGSLFLNKENVAVPLVKEGLASVHSNSADGLSWAKLLHDAEEEAKQARCNIWKDYDESKELNTETVTETCQTEQLEVAFFDVIVSDVRVGSGFGFSVQILDTEGIASLEMLMREFSTYHQSYIPSSHVFLPKGGDLVSAKFSDGFWYRAKVRRASPLKKEAELTFIDYGNQSIVPFTDIRPLDAQFRSLPGQAHDARLSFVKLPGPESDYYQEAIDRFRARCEGRRLIANTDYKEGNLFHLRLIDPENPPGRTFSSINAELLSEGLACIDHKGCHYLNSYPNVLEDLRKSVLSAKKDRAGMFEFGDVEEDDY